MIIQQAVIDDLASLIGQLPNTDDAYVYLEGIHSQWLTADEGKAMVQFAKFSPTIPWAKWQCGRIFSPSFELRWQLHEKGTHIVYCGEEAVDNLTFEPIAEYFPKERSIYLWGTKVQEKDLAKVGNPAQSPIFAELQIPRLNHYPVSDKAQRVKLSLLEYYDQAHNLLYHRFCTLEEDHEPI